MRLKKIAIFILIGIFVLTTGCASIVSKTTYPVKISSNPEQVTISVIDEKGESVFKGQTPTMVSLPTKAGYFRGKSYTVTFEKDGYSDQTVQINKKLDGWYIGNILFGGLIGFLVVDPLTGAMWRLDKEVKTELTQVFLETVDTDVVEKEGEIVSDKIQENDSEDAESAIEPEATEDDNDFEMNNFSKNEFHIIQIDDVPEKFYSKMVRIN